MSRTTPAPSSAGGAPDEQELRRTILEILDENYLMSIATVRTDGWPQVTLVNYLRQGHALYFVSARDSQKFTNIARDSRVSVAIGGGPGRDATIRGVSLAGRAGEVIEPYRIAEINELIQAKAATGAFTPHPTSSLVAVIEIRPLFISVIDYTSPPGRHDLIRVIDDWAVSRDAPPPPQPKLT